MSGKGSAPRPYSVSNEEYANRWNAIFGRDLKPCPHNVWAIHSSSTKDNTVYVCMECGFVSKDTQATR
jgi:rubrerythrin